MLLSMTGETVAKAYAGIPDAGPAEVFLFMLPVVMSLEKTGSEEWHEKLWRLVQHSWSQEAKKETDRKLKWRSSDKTHSRDHHPLSDRPNNLPS